MPKKESVHVVVDDETIAAGDHWKVIHPVWWSADVYNGPGRYEQSLRPFSEPQRYVFAVRWYLSEINNGGHLQFYSNATGIVWKDALAGFEAIGLPKAAQILQISANRLGGSPSLDRQERQDQIDEYQPDFDDCDEALYKLNQRVSIESNLMDYIRANASAFHFSGTIERIVLPPH